MAPKVDGRIVQACYIVDDLDRAVEAWVETLGAGPFFVQKNLNNVAVEYRGKPSFLDIHVALGQAGPIQIELIEVVGKHPSVYTDVFPDGGTGFHHFAIFVNDIEAEVKAYVDSGATLGCRGLFAGTPFAYIDTRRQIGFFTEVYQDAPGMREMYRKIAAAADNWDRADRVRPLADVVN